MLYSSVVTVDVLELYLSLLPSVFCLRLPFCRSVDVAFLYSIPVTCPDVDGVPHHITVGIISGHIIGIARYNVDIFHNVVDVTSHITGVAFHIRCNKLYCWCWILRGTIGYRSTVILKSFTKASPALRWKVFQQTADGRVFPPDTARFSSTL